MSFFCFMFSFNPNKMQLVRKFWFMTMDSSFFVCLLWNAISILGNTIWNGLQVNHYHRLTKWQNQNSKNCNEWSLIRSWNITFIQFFCIYNLNNHVQNANFYFAMCKYSSKHQKQSLIYIYHRQNSIPINTCLNMLNWFTVPKEQQCSQNYTV